SHLFCLLLRQAQRLQQEFLHIIFTLFYLYLIIISKSIHCKNQAVLSTSIPVCCLKDS
ncbi:uncharacterized protein DC041_0012656, partial [Schistosoma bovis]